MMDAEMKAELTQFAREQIRTQIAIQAVAQIVIQGIAYGSMLTILWRLERTAQQVLEVLQDLPGEALESLPSGFGF